MIRKNKTAAFIVGGCIVLVIIALKILTHPTVVDKLFIQGRVPDTTGMTCPGIVVTAHHRFFFFISRSFDYCGVPKGWIVDFRHS